MHTDRPPTASPADRGAPAHTGAAPARAELWWALAGMLSYPGPDLAAAVAAGRLGPHVAALVADLPYDLAVDVAALGDPGGRDRTDGLGPEYLRLFEVPGPSGRPCPLHVGAHGRDRRAVMEELLRFYRHFGLTTAGAAQSELPDALATVAEFLGFLATREAAAPPGRRGGVRAAQHDVLRRHVAPAAAAIAERVGRMEPLPFYGAATRLLAGFAAAEVSELAG